MPLHEFWHGEESLLYAYEKAYYNDMYQRAYVIGAYNEAAFSIVYGRVWGDKKNIEYGKEIEMRDMIAELNEKQAQRSAQYRAQKANYISERVQRANLNWI